MPHSIDQIEQDLGNLINMSGKLRMLSHQVVMCALLHYANNGDPTFAELGDAALVEFQTITALLTHPKTNNALSPATAELLIAQMAVEKPHEDHLRRFITKAVKLAKAPDCTAATELGTFVAGDLLSTLNAINAHIRALLDHKINENRQAQQPLIMAATHSLTEINRISKTLQIVAMNASIEAQRAGTAGASFGEIAREMRSLSLQGIDQAKRLSRDLSTFEAANA